MSHTKSTIPVPGAAELRRLYIDEGKSMVDIARACGRDPGTIHYWMGKHGIPTRARGHDTRVHFKKGRANPFKGKTRPLTDECRKRLADAARRHPRLPHLVGGKHWLKSAAPELNPKWKGGITPERQTFYRSVEWKEACKAVWARADACCERCGKDHRLRDRRTEPKFHIHHIVSFAVRELRAEPSNLALLCRPCHLFVHSNANAAGEFIRTIDILEAADEEAAA